MANRTYSVTLTPVASANLFAADAVAEGVEIGVATGLSAASPEPSAAAVLFAPVGGIELFAAAGSAAWGANCGACMGTAQEQAMFNSRNQHAQSCTVTQASAFQVHD